MRRASALPLLLVLSLVLPPALAGAVATAGTAATAGVSPERPSAGALPGFAAVRAQVRSSETLLLDRHGTVLHRLRTDFRVRRGAWVALADVSPVFVQMMLRSEDRRFFEHGGVDWWAVPAAAWSNLWHEQVRGASTLSMQLAALLDPSLQRRGGARSFLQKMHQARAARQLEADWRKDQILEAWLNLVPFRGELVGVDAMARTLLGKTAAGLDAQESALAAAMVRAPNAAPARVAARACELLQAWRQTQLLWAPPSLGEADGADGMRSDARGDGTHDGKDSRKGSEKGGDKDREKDWKKDQEKSREKDQEKSQEKDQMNAGTGGRRDGVAVSPCLSLQVLAGMTLHRHDWSAGEGMAPHLAARLVREDPQGVACGQISSTLDAGLQALAIQTLQTQLRELRHRQVEDGAVVVLDNASGDILVWVGSSGTLSQAAEVDGVTARRQPGSTLKPFLYGQALAERRLTAASLLDDAPAQLSTASGLYIPQNHDHHYRGWVSVRTALASSLNIPAVRTLVMVTPDAFHAQLQRLGFSFPESGGFYGYSLALGSAEVSLLQLTNAFRALANGGRWCPVQGRKRERETLSPEPRCHQALDAGAAFIVADMLSDRHARIPSFGTDSILNTPFWSAVKTGTSKDMRDNWAIGFSRHHTVGVWVGNASGAPMHDVVGTSGAAPVWATLMRELNHRRPGRPPRAPAGLIRQRVQFVAPAGRRLGVGVQGPNGRGAASEMSETSDTTEASETPETPETAETAGTSESFEAPEAPRMEWFLPGTAPVVAEADAGSRRAAGLGEAVSGETLRTARILTPSEGTIIALDPDIPPAHQRVWLRAAVPDDVVGDVAGAPARSRAGLRWTLDGKMLGEGARLSWFPLPGRHTLRLLDDAGRVLDVRHIEVRVAWLGSGPEDGR